MKKFSDRRQFNFLSTYLTGVLFVCLVALITSCSFINTIGLRDTVLFDGDGKDVMVVSLCIDGGINVSKGNCSVSRTVRNPVLTAGDLVFYLYGSASDGTNYRSEMLALDGTSGDLELTIPRNNWDLTLAGFSSTAEAPDKDNQIDINSTALLKGSSQVNNQRWKTTAVFTLSDAYLTTPGDVSLNLELDGWNISGADPTYSVAVSLLNMDETEELPLSLTEIVSGEFWSSETIHVDAGYWYLQVSFTRTVNSYNEFNELSGSYEENYIFCDLLYVQPGKGVTSTVLIEDIIGTL